MPQNTHKIARFLVDNYLSLQSGLQYCRCEILHEMSNMSGLIIF